MPRLLQSEIHSEYSADPAVWTAYKADIESMFDASTLKEDFNDHLIREYNRKIERLNQSSDLYITPFDGGFRFIGSDISTAKS